MNDLTDIRLKRGENMNLRFEEIKIKESVEYYADAIKKDDLIVFLDNSIKKVIKHNKGTHVVTLEDKKEYDLYTIYDSIQTVLTVYDHSGNLSKQFMFFTVHSAVRFLTFNCKYHAYPEVVAAVLNGNKDHYIKKYCKGFKLFGIMPSISVEDVKLILAMLEVGGLVRQKQSKRGYSYYYARKDNRIWKREFVFYVCYGSNLLEERFLCYITGKENKRYGVKAGEKCKDQSPIVLKTTLRIPYEMYFGNRSSSWDNGGVCFIKPTKATDSKKYSFATAYLITKEQYEHVWKREGKSSNWYGKEIELNPIRGIPTKTFTSEDVHEYNAPCKRYIDVVRAGLIEWGLSYKQATQYLYVKTNK